MIRFARKFALAVGKDFRFPLADFLLEERVVQLDQPAVMFNQNSVYQTGSLTVGSPFLPVILIFSIRWLALFGLCLVSEPQIDVSGYAMFRMWVEAG